MTDLSQLNPDVIVPRMIGQARDVAGPLWAEIRTAAQHEFKVLGDRISAIGKAVHAGEMSKSSARILLRMARRNLIATLAMLTTMIDAAVQKMVNAVLAEIKDHINTAIGFTLI